MQRKFTATERSQGISLKRGLSLILMSFLVPGSAQIAYGKRRYGFWMLRLIGLLLFFVLLLVVGFFVFRKFTIGIYANGILPQILAYSILTLGIADILLLWHAWWLANPRKLSKIGVVLLTALALFFSVIIGGITNYAYGLFASQAKVFKKVFVGSTGSDLEPVDGRINVLLIGGDSAQRRAGWGVRTDSMTVASISVKTGRTVLFSLARNTQHVPFPSYSPMKEFYPNGFSCPKRGENECILNAVYTYAMDHADKYPGVKDPGLQATIEAAEGFTGLKLNYWVFIDMDGFEKLIDAMGGITLDVIKPVPVGDDMSRIKYWIPAGKDVKLGGYQALWFARSRADSSDYVRMVRQKCVMNAFLRKMNPYELVKHFTEIASASADMISTNLPATGIEEMITLASKAKQLPVKSVNFVPPLINTAKPDWKFIHAKIKNSIAESEQLDKEALESGNKQESPAQSAASTTNSEPEKPIQNFDNVHKPGTAITAKAELKNGETDNLDEICSAK